MMRKASVRDLRYRYTELLASIAAGQEVLITQRGKTIARLVPEQRVAQSHVDWSQSPAVQRDRSSLPCLDAGQARRILEESSGQW